MSIFQTIVVISALIMISYAIYKMNTMNKDALEGL